MNTRNQRRGEENATIYYRNDFDENVDEAEDDDADDESDSNFQQEFDVESGSEEEERPPQVESALTPCASLGHLWRANSVCITVHHCDNTLHSCTANPGVVFNVKKNTRKFIFFVVENFKISGISH